MQGDCSNCTVLIGPRVLYPKQTFKFFMVPIYIWCQWKIVYISPHCFKLRIIHSQANAFENSKISNTWHVVAYKSIFFGMDYNHTGA